MTEKSPDSTDQSKDTTNVLPLLSKAEAPVTVSLTIDKSVSKVAAWVMIVMGFAMAMIGAGIVLSMWMIDAYQKTEREIRLQRLEVDEMNVRLELAKIPRHKPGDKP